MKFTNTFGVKDRVSITVRDANGNLIDSVTPYEDECYLGKFLNKLGLKKCAFDYMSNTGIADIMAYIHDNYIYVGLGTDSTGSADYTRTELGAQLYRLAADSVEYSTTVVTNDTVVITTEFTMDTTATIAETALFTASTGGTMPFRQTFTGIALSSGVKVTIEWTVQLTR